MMKWRNNPPGKPSSPPRKSVLGPPPGAIGPGDVQTQFAVVKLKDGQTIVQFPVSDPASKTVDIAAALELCGAGLQTLAQVVREAIKKEESLITVIPGLPPEMMKPGAIIKK
jgi:hypothetical protein